MKKQIHILEETTPDFQSSRPFQFFTQRCLNPIGLAGTDVIIHKTLDSVISSGTKHVFYFHPPWTVPSTEMRKILPSGKNNDKGEERKPIGIKQIRGSRYFHKDLEIIPTFHPQTCMGTYKNWWLIGIDFKRFIRDIQKGYQYPEFETILCKDVNSALEYLNLLKELPITYGDIEGTLDSGGITCIGFSLSNTKGFTIPFCDLQGNSVFSIDDEIIIWDKVEEVCREIPTGWHNYLYDAFVLAYGYGIIIGNLVEDTMIKTWELWSEHPKSLGFAASLYTDNPYWKSERTDGDWDTELVYNIKDCCITHECGEKMGVLLENDTGALGNYQENVEILPILLYMMLQGMWIDKDEKKRLLAEAEEEVERLQELVDKDWLTSGLGIKDVEKYNKEKETIGEKIRDITKEKAQAEFEWEVKPLKKWSNKIAVCDRKIQRLLDKADKLEYPSLNAKSSKQKDDYLYSKHGLGLKKPKKFLSTEEGVKDKSATASIIVIQKMVNKTTPQKTKEKLQNLLLLTIARTSVSDIKKLTVDPLDGRLRCNYTMFTETGRLTCRSSNIPMRGWRNFI